MQYESEVSENRKGYMMSSEKLVKPARNADDFFSRYSVENPGVAASKVRNAYSDVLVRFAHDEGKKLAGLIPDSKYAIGGSLGYGALLQDNYDVDLRLLLKADATPAEIDEAVYAIMQMGGYSNPRFISENGTNYIWHLRKEVLDEDLAAYGLPEADLTLNVQAESGYGGIAAVSAKLPTEVIDRYIVAKELSAKEGRACYTAVKDHWKCFVSWVKIHGYHFLDETSMTAALKERVELFPLFLKDKDKGGGDSSVDVQASE